MYHWLAKKKLQQILSLYIEAVLYSDFVILIVLHTKVTNKS